MLGWWVNGKLLRRTAAPVQQLKLFEHAMPEFGPRSLHASPGRLSLLAVAKNFNGRIHRSVFAGTSACVDSLRRL